MKYIFRLCFLLIFIVKFVLAQSNATLSGFVYDEKTGEALIGANVFIEGTRIGSATNVSGFYSLPGVNTGEYKLICRLLGYEPAVKNIRVTADRNLEINIRIKPTTIVMQSVSVVAESVKTIDKLYNKPISKINLSPRQIQLIPQIIEADLLRSLQTMPGVASLSDFSTELYVRGGTPDQNLYMIDGTDVYNPEHLFGLFSTFNTDAIKNVEFSKGGFGAEYGGRLSSILSVSNLDGNRREYSGKISISLLSAKTTLQVPLGSIGALSGSIRRTYFDKTIAKMKALKDENIPDYYFYDGHLKTYLDLGPHDKITISTYRGYDDMNHRFDDDNPNSEEMDYNWGNATASFRWTHIFSPQLFGNFWLTSSRFESKFDLGDNINEKNSLVDHTAKGNFEYYFSQQLIFKTGFEYKFTRGLYESKFPGGEVDVEQAPKYFYAYFQTQWRPTPLLELQAGLRLNSCMNGVYLLDLDPRFSLKYRLTETMNLKAAVGRYHQYLFKIPRFFIADIWTSSDKYYADSRSDHFILGFQKEVAGNYEFEVESYFKDYNNLFFYDPFFWVDLNPKSYNKKGEPFYRDTEGLFDSGNGRAVGVEFLLRKDVGPITGWVSYTLGRSEFNVLGLNRNKNFVPRHDRTSTFNMVANIDLNNAVRSLKSQLFREDRGKWRIGLGLVYASGQPITTTSSVYVTSQLPDQNFYRGYNLYPTERNNFRLPPYIRLDLSITYLRKYKGITFEPFLQFYNVTNRKNVWFISYEDEIKDDMIIQNVETQGMLPILPSIGFNLTF